MCTVAQAVLERFKDEIAFHFGHGTADQVASDLFRRYCGVSGDISATGLVEPCAIRRENSVDADFNTA